MDKYIDKQLILWANWAKSGKTQLGYPKKSAFVVSGRSGPTTINDAEGMRISRCVAALDPTLRTAIECWYLRMTHCTADQIAVHLNICRDTLYTRIHKAHIEIMGYMQDIAAGIPIGEEKKKRQED